MLPRQRCPTNLYNDTEKSVYIPNFVCLKTELKKERDEKSLKFDFRYQI